MCKKNIVHPVSRGAMPPPLVNFRGAVTPCHPRTGALLHSQNAFNIHTIYTSLTKLSINIDSPTLKIGGCNCIRALWGHVKPQI